MGREIIEPYNVYMKAVCPRPSRINWCPGRIDRIVSSSGAPKYMLGIKSIKVWVIDIATMNMVNVIGEMFDNNGSESEAKMIEDIKLIWIPGDKPVRVPARIPNRKHRAISKSIWVKSESILKSFSFFFQCKIKVIRC